MSHYQHWTIEKTALLTIDLQNDFLHPEGAYGRAGQGSDAIGYLKSKPRPTYTKASSSIQAYRYHGGASVPLDL